MNTHNSLFPPGPTSFFNGEKLNFQKLSKGSNFQKDLMWEKGQGRGNVKIIDRWGFFIFIFSLPVMMVTDTFLGSLV